MSTQSRLGAFIAVSGAMSLLALTAPAEISDPVVLLWSLFCSVLMIASARRHRGTTRRTAWLLAGAATLTAIGFLVRGIHGEMVGEPQPMPSPADFIHIPAYSLFVLTALHVHRSRSTRRDVDAWLDAAALILALFIMMWVTFLGDFVTDDSLDPGLRILNSVYNLLIYSAGTVFLRITSTPGHRPVSYYILGVAGGAYIVSDIAATYSLARGTGLTLAVALSPIVYGLAAAAIRHPSAPMIAVPHEEEELRVGSLRLFIVALTILTPLVTFGHDGGPVSVTVLICAATLLAGLVVTRVVRLLRQQQRTSDLDRQLATELAQLAALDSAGAIVARIPEVAQRLLPEGTSIVLSSGDDSDHEQLILPRALRVDGFDVAEIRGVLPPPAHLRVVASLLRDAGLLADAAEGVAASARQASEAAANERIAENERRFRALVQNSSDLVFVLDEGGRVDYVSDSVTNVTGHGVEEFDDRPLSWILHENDVATAEQIFEGVLSRTNRQAVHELRVRHADGSIRLFETVMTDMRQVPAVGGVVLNATDVTERRSLERDLRDAETTDPLTLLLNRNAFLDETEAAIRRASITGEAVTIATIDLDDFKTINDALGPVLADRVLVEMAQRIRASIRLTDTVARLSGDEYGVLMPEGYSSIEALAAIERILRDLATEFDVEGRTITPSATAGLATDTGGVSTATQLLRNADVALSQAKTELRGQALLFEESMALAVSERLDLRSSFQRALREGELRLAYQPIVDFTSGRIVSLEALARWRHPSRGEVSPVVFIPIAEESNFISELGEWALRTACVQMNEWAAAGLDDFTVSVNVSGHQLRERDVIGRVREILAETGVDPSRITIEITESVLIDDTDFIADRIHALRGLGVSLAIDDFGTGYSSLSYLQRYEFDILKIDRAFVSPLAAPERTREREIVASIISLARGLGATTVAEGIEEEDEYEVLRALGCDRAQGYLFYRPTEAQLIAGILARAAGAVRAA